MADLGSVGKITTKQVYFYGGVISGVVLDSLSSPAAHLVRASERDSNIHSGGTVSNPVTGEYTLYTSIIFIGKPHVVHEIDPTKTENARVFDNVIPI